MWKVVLQASNCVSSISWPCSVPTGTLKLSENERREEKNIITTISTASPRRSTHIGPAYENSIGSRPSSYLAACQRQVQVYPKNRHCTYLWTARPLAGGEVVVAVVGPSPRRGGREKYSTEDAPRR